MVGAPLDFTPEHTWGLDLTYAHGGTTVSTNWQGLGQVGNGQYEDALSIFERGTQLRTWVQNSPRIELPFSYHSIGQGYATGDLNVRQQLTAHVDADAYLSNITSIFQNEGYDDATGTSGRTGRLGLNIRF
jgi:hypothetical protein